MGNTPGQRRRSRGGAQEDECPTSRYGGDPTGKLYYRAFAVVGKQPERRLETGGSPELVVDRHGHGSANPVTIPREKQKIKPPGIEQVFLMASRNYKVSATVGVATAVATPVYILLDTGAGPNLVREDVLPEDWFRYRLAGDTTYQVIGANGRSLAQRGVVTLWVPLERLRAQARFIGVKQLAAGCILGCQFIDRHVKSIHLKEKIVLLNDGAPVAILRAATPPAMGETDVERGRKPTPSTKIRLARFAKIAARSECLVEVHCDAPGQNFLQASLRHSSTGVYMANGLSEILPNLIFRVRVVNASLTYRLLPKGMILGNAMPHPTGIGSLVEQEAETLAKTVPMGCNSLCHRYTMLWA
jgi:hypothetical protein